MRDYVFVHINGEPVEVRGRHVFETAARFMRLERGLTGTKIVCDEGDCGACTVLIGRAVNGQMEYRPINACIQHMYQLDRAHVVTVEGIPAGPIQQRMIEHHGAQCGFCTPGFVVALAGLLEDHSTLTERDVRDGLTGNLCRCTGYEPIVKAALSADASEVLHLNEQYPPEGILEAIADLGPVHVDAGGRSFFAPDSLDEAIRFKGGGAIIVHGGTDVGVWCNKRDFDPTAVLSLEEVEDMNRLEVAEGRLEVGGCVTLSALEEAMRDVVPPFYRILRLFGSPQIRHAGTLAGNVANASPIADSLPFLFVTEAELELAGLSGRRRLPIRDFYKGYKSLDMAPDELITKVIIPLPAEGDVLRLYKVSKRRDLDISTFTAAFLMRERDGRIESIRIAYGGVGPVVLRLPKTEAWLRGKPLSEAAFIQAGESARDEITPISDVRGSRDFRLTLAETILLKFYHECEEVMV